MEKICETCGKPFVKRPKDSLAQWQNRAFCSLACSNKLKKTMPTHLYFWKHTDRRQDHECWPWIGTTDGYGYGRVVFMTSYLKAHRVSYELRYGPIADGMVVRHKCDNPNCVNPFHLEEGTQKQNMQDASMRGRLNPKSLGNLRPGKKGVRGAGPTSQKEIHNAK